MMMTRLQIISTSERMWVEMSTVWDSAEVADELADLADLVRVEAVGGLVEDEQFGIVDEGIGQADALAVAFREGLDHLAAHAVEAAGVDDLADAAAGVAVAEALELGAEFQVFPDAHVLVERDVFRHVADFAAGLDGLAEDVEAGDGGGAGGGRQVAGEHPQGGGFARAVGAEEADDFAAGHGKGDAADRFVAGVSFGELRDFDHEYCGCRGWR